MNSAIAKKRMNQVINMDIITSSEPDFLATHAALEKIYVHSDRWDGKAEAVLSEEQVYHRYILNQGNNHQFLLVMGEPGTGKSHLIRWFAARFRQAALEAEVVLFIRRNDNTLKGTLRQLLDLPEVVNIPNKEVYDRLVSAATIIDNRKLRFKIYQEFIVEIESDDESEILSNTEKRRLLAFLQDEDVQSRLMGEGNAFNRIYNKVSESVGISDSDVAALFNANDFKVDVDFTDELISHEASKNARKMADALLADDDFELTNRIVEYMNTHVDAVIQQCAGLKPGDLEEVFHEIRKELKKQGKNLTILIEDITAFTGINLALLNALMARHDGMNEEMGLCRLNSVVGTTIEYFKTYFKDNYQQRVTKYFIIPNNAFGETESGLCEFVGRYLNVMSLPFDVIAEWTSNGASMDEYPVHEVTEGKNWDSIELKDGKRLNLFPFTKRAVINLYNCILESAHRTPRFLLRDVVERVLKDYFMNLDRFPGFQIERPNLIPVWNPNEHRQYIRRQVEDDEFKRLELFIRIWGDANAYEIIVTDSNECFLGGINKKCYRDLKLAEVSGYKENGLKVKDKDNGHREGLPEARVQNQGTSVIKEEKVSQAQIDYQVGLDTLDVWIAGGTLNVGATTKDVVNITMARDELNAFLYSAIKWQEEGVSPDNLNKTRLSYKKGLVGFERQTRGLDKFLVILPANNETQLLVEAFLAYVTLGKKGNNEYSWDFPNAWRHLYYVQLWLEKNKKGIIEAVNCSEGKKVDYYEYAIASEMIRQLLFGIYEGKTLEGISAKSLIASNLKKKTDNAHNARWNELMDIICRCDQQIKDTIIQYFNIIQGGTKSSQVFLRYVDYLDAVKSVKKKRLVLNLDKTDSMSARQELQDIWMKIEGRITVVVEQEEREASKRLHLLTSYVGGDNMDDDDIMDLLKKVKDFYEAAERTHFNIQSNPVMISDVKKNAKGICSAIEEIKTGLAASDSIDKLIAFSQDPMERINKLLTLMEKVEKDIQYVNNNVSKRREDLGIVDDGATETKYAEEKIQLAYSGVVVAGWEAQE